MECVFLAALSPKVFFYFNVSKMAIFGAPSSPLWKDRRKQPLTSLYKIDP